MLTNVRFSLGVDQNTGSAVVIKLAHPDDPDDMTDVLENEYLIYSLLGAEGSDTSGSIRQLINF